MRTSHRCPKCQHGEVLFVPTLRDTDYDQMVLHRFSVWSNESTGPLEAYVCRACGYAELYVTKPGEVAFDRIPGARILTAEVPPPYR